MGKLGVVQVRCQRCGTPLRALTGSLLLSTERHESLGCWCARCVTPAKLEALNKAVMDAVDELAG